MSVLYTANKGQARIAVTTTPKEGRFRASGESEGVCLTPPNGLTYMMSDELGFPRRKRGEHGKAGNSASARVPKRADDPSRGLVAREALDVAHYITDMTAQLEAMAVRRISTSWLISSGWRKRKANSLFAPTPSPKPSVKLKPKTLMQPSLEFASPT